MPLTIEDTSYLRYVYLNRECIHNSLQFLLEKCLHYVEVVEVDVDAQDQHTEWLLAVVTLCDLMKQLVMTALLLQEHL